MTTIAYRDGVMAADTQETCGDIRTRTPKLARLPCGGVAGASGDSAMCVQALEWLSKGKGDRPKLLECSVMVAYGDGRLGIYADKKWTFLPFYGFSAIGSGMGAALGAMAHYGATAGEAVECAAKVDVYTSAPVETMAVEPKRAKRR